MPVTPLVFAVTISPVPAGLPEYDRRNWKHWTDADGDCQDARNEVLIAESATAVTFRTNDQCRVASGEWLTRDKRACLWHNDDVPDQRRRRPPPTRGRPISFTATTAFTTTAPPGTVFAFEAQIPASRPLKRARGPFTAETGHPTLGWQSDDGC